ncbi:T9SS type A sorting domain-containing protein [Winogradskyella forsetii]|uniref:T9SS type A sorting domain-containing protein n=1 Tax=Winogradskyella forsetii TaxID=2686077 RepID=UPI0015B85A44|nr:T9SS type A sorting domain-containing protein [Winogradskyella forsetii]
MKKRLLSALCLFVITFTYAQIPPGCPTTIWDGSNWSAPYTGVGPNINVNVIIAGNYDTSLQNASFECCSLLINAGVSLNITPEYFVRVQNTTTVNGDLTVRHQGSFVQVEEFTTGFTLGPPPANATVIKSIDTPFSSAITYWSSPISGETISQTYDPNPSLASYRYFFKTENFRDLEHEQNNDNIYVPGIGIDGVNDLTGPAAWTLANATSLAATSGILDAGRGLITRQATDGSFDYTFDGTFNTSTINVNVTRNDENLSPPVTDPVTAPGNDENPILLGNPYASAIDLVAFLSANTYPNGILDGYVSLWSPSAAPINTNNGNQVLNFSETDYFYMNLSGSPVKVCETLPFGTCDPVTNPVINPDQNSIPSGQGFFANFTDQLPSPATGIVRFDNSMRVNEENLFFYRGTSSITSNEDNKLWLNLNSPSGVNENILLSYVDGATSGNDGRAYDLDLRVPYNSPYSLIYFNINGSDDKFRIQGKNTNDLNRSEEVSLGFYNTVEGVNGAPQEFAISITQVQGDFMTNRTTFLVDHLLDICYNLSDSPYFFTAGIGEFNDRFTLKYLDCDFSDSCSAVFDEIESFVVEKSQCGKYRINFPNNYDFSDYDLVLTQDGVDTPLTEDTNIYFTENGLNEVTISVYDSSTKTLCYSNEIIRYVDCFKDKCDTCEDAFTEIVGLIQDRNKCGKFKVVFPKSLRGCYDLVINANGIIIPMTENTTIQYDEDGFYALYLTLYDKETGEECYTGSTILSVDCFNNTSNRSANNDDVETDDVSGIKLYPNPAESQFTVTLNNELENLQQVTVRDIMGTVVKKSNIQTVKLNGLHTGIYFVEVITTKGVVYRKQLAVR